MTTTENLREYLDAHGIDGPPAEPGWHAARHRNGHVGVIFTDWSARHNGAFAGPFTSLVATDRGPECLTRDLAHTSGGYSASDIVRHAPLAIAPPASPR